MPFRGEFITKNIDDTWAMLKEPVIFDSDWFGDTFESKTGFITDFSSVPRVPIVYEFFGGKGKRAATNHDDGYLRGEEPKRRVDLRFLEGLIDTFVKDAVKEYARSSGWAAYRVFWKIVWRFFLSAGMWLGVVVGGWPTWWKYSKRRAAGLPLRPEAPDVEDYRWEDYIF
jgi:hypothetical protein